MEELEKQVIFWSKIAIWIPTIFTLMLVVAYTANIFHVVNLFYFACGLYFITAVIWWWWTMKSIYVLINILKRANIKLETTIEEVVSIKKDIQVD